MCNRNTKIKDNVTAHTRVNTNGHENATMKLDMDVNTDRKVIYELSSAAKQ